MKNFYGVEGLVETFLFVSAWLIAAGGVQFKVVFLINVAVEDLIGAIPSWLAFIMLMPIILGVLILSALVYVIELLLSPERDDNGGLLPI